MPPSPAADPVDPVFVREFQRAPSRVQCRRSFWIWWSKKSLRVPARVWRAAFNECRPLTSRKSSRFVRPGLIVWGERDSYASREDQEALHRLIPNSRLICYPDVGHAVH